ncbi:MAG TPA: hypothetical protein PLO53_14365, partial [Candidatus Hydrogenedentes bacterium]|nr:hypothetical protein [Candidatus Hydrogenedentota bacterium]
MLIQPDTVRHRVVVEVAARGDADSTEVHLSIPEIGVETSGTPGTHELPVPVSFRWSPEQPKLLTLAVSLKSKDGRTYQTLRKRWGMRSLSIQDRRLYLNGHPFFMRAAALDFWELPLLEQETPEDNFRLLTKE